MKLPIETPLTNGNLKPNQGETPHNKLQSASPTQSTQSQQLPPKIQALINTWAKIQTVQPLPPKQNQQVLSQLSALIGQPSPNTQQGSGISKQLHLGGIAQSLDRTQVFESSTQLALIKLLSVKGAISVLSAQSVKVGEEVRISQNSQGQLIFTTQPNGQKLNFQSQFLPRDVTAKLNPIIDNHHINQHLTHSVQAKPLAPIPPSILTIDKAAMPELVKQAFQSNGQNFEPKLAQLFSAIKQLAPQNPNHPNGPELDNHSLNQPITQKIQQVEQSIQKWVQQFQHKMESPQTIQSQSPASSNLKQTEPLVFALQTLLSPTTVNQKTPQNIEQLIQSIQNDQKNWLGQNQIALVQKLTQVFAKYGEQFIPNWSSQTLQSPNIKTFNDLNLWLDFLIKPKFSTGEEGSLLKTGVSAQAQLNQTLSLLSNSLKTDDNNELTIIRQLLNLSQNLMKISAEQLFNRNWFQQPDLQAMQFSLPYLHQNQIDWCELEFKAEQENKQIKNQQTKSWYLILRFDQQSTDAFAIESKIIQEILSITLWSDSVNRLKQLNEDMPLFKQKLTNAGFKLDSITTKHGQPTPLNKPIQQSLIDIHT